MPAVKNEVSGIAPEGVDGPRHRKLADQSSGEGQKGLPKV